VCVISLVNENLDKVNWFRLRCNKNSGIILRKNIHKLNKDDCYYLSSHSEHIDLLKENVDKLNWNLLSKNVNAINLLKKKQIGIYYQKIKMLLIY
tara:strand:+ start:115 stop:399 length:285 start_codon:yes stop_codon:yes gene_type:complete